MNEMTCFINSHPDIQRTVLLTGDSCTYQHLRGFITTAIIKKLIVTGNLSKKNVDEIKENIQRDQKKGSLDHLESLEYIDFCEFQGISGSWALCCDGADPRLILEAGKYHPTYLLAEIHQDYTGAFKIWEAYREHTSCIQIKTLRNDLDPQVLLWKKQEDNDIELSVIFPMYNVAAYLDQCIESVTAWKAPYVEFLFVNDGSPDHSREIVLEWAKRDPRVKLLDKPNGGCASARQFGLEKARGNYIGFIDPDDFIDESMFRKLLRAAMTGSYDVSYCGYNEYYENTGETKRVEDALGCPYRNGTSDLYKIHELLLYCRVAIWRGIYKAEMLRKNRIHFYTDLRRFDDLPFKFETFAAAKSVIAVPEYLYYYRLARPGQDVSADDERLYVHFDIFSHLNDMICAGGDARLIDYLQMCKIQTHIYALSKIRPEFKKTYIARAKADLLSTGERERTYEIAKKRVGQLHADYYAAIMDEDLSRLEIDE